jgi:hypothetical protein
MEKPTFPPKYRTIPAPAPGSGLKFVGPGSRGGLTDEELAKYVGPDGAPVAGGTIPTTVGTGGVWGSSGASVSGYGTVQRATLARRADKENFSDNNGEVVAYLYYNYRYEGSCECLVPASFAALEPGSTISIGGQTLYVDEAEQQWQYRGWKMYSIKASKHDTIV